MMYLKPNRQQQGTKVVTTPLTQLTGVAENSISQQKPKPVLPHRSREYHELFKMIQRLSLFADLHIDGVWLTSLPEVETQAYKLLERVTDIHEIWYERYVTRDHPNVFVQSVKSVITTCGRGAGQASATPTKTLKKKMEIIQELYNVFI
jgi:hypothetical protein